ncbi:exosporium protein C [Bacillus methanolicus]|uniref:exosporium protein C n=1 Tax=Bacillus methanolicus TaxID=1471 RepID=UPI00200D0FC9|nr:exosporium protein C [Bacillus methanolicus]UQD51861.1 exosporium protein C [Bacillus methanolicus]
MPEIILDYKASEPSNQTGVVPAFALPVGGTQLADLGIFIVPPVPAINRIELKGTVGLQALTGTPVVFLRIFRQVNGMGPDVEIFNARFTPEPSPAEAFYTASFLTIDFNVSAATGFIIYKLRGEILAAPAGTVNVVGPVSFTGLAVGNID